MNLLTKLNAALIATFLVAWACSMPALAKKTVEIGILFDYVIEDYQPIFDQLGHEISSVVGNDAEIVYGEKNLLVNNFDAELAEQQYQALVAGNVDIILAFGPVNNQVISNLTKHAKPTILFGAINTDVNGIDYQKQSSGINNYSYVITPSSYQKDLQDFRSIYPFARLGIVGAHGPWDSERARKSIKEAFANIDASYEFIPYESIEQFSQQLDSVDAIYLAEGFGIPFTEIAEIAQLLIARNIPSFTTNRQQDVEAGWLMTNQSADNIKRLFRRIALNVEAVVSGENLSSRPVHVDLSDTLTVNYNTAEKIGLPIRYSQVSDLNIIGSFDDLVVDKSYSLEEAVETAIRNNLSLAADIIDVELAKDKVDSAKTAYFPDLSATVSAQYLDPDLARLSGGQNPEEKRSGSLNFSQTIYSEDSSAGISIQKSLFAAQQENFNARVLDTVLSTTQTSLNLLRLKNAMRSRQQSVEITRRNLNVAQQKFDAGQSSKADIFRFRSEMANNMQALIDAFNNYQQGQYALNAVLNAPLEQRVEIQAINIDDGPFKDEEFGYKELSDALDNPRRRAVFENFLLLNALSDSHELRALEHNLASVERDIAQYGWRRFIPTVSANAQYNNTFDRGGVGVPDPNLALDNDYNVGLVFSIPIFNRNADNVSRRSALKKKQQLEIKIAQQKQFIEKQIRDTVSNVSGRISRIELAAAAEKAAKQSLELVEISYASGAVTITDLIDSQNNYVQAQLASSNAVFDFLDSALSMERAVGNFFFFTNDKLQNEEFIKRFREYRSKNTSSRLRGFSNDKQL